MTTYEQSIAFLYGLSLFGTKPGLENTRRLTELAGNPHQGLRFVHVAGTNGKGSTCAILESIYRHAGLRVGLFTSPHLVRFGERIQVDRRLMSDGDVIRFVGEATVWLKHFSEKDHPTFFEVVTVMALRYFAEQRCGLVIWETGMGGRLDATNIVTPLASVITNVQLDHQKWLGQTIDEIAVEKAGIIKRGVPVITAATAGLDVVTQTARALDASLSVVKAGSNAHVPLAGEHQRLNAAVALETVRVLQNKLPVSETAVRDGLRNVSWPGRLQTVVLPDGRRVILDGAHNIPAIETVLREIKDHPAIIFGVLRDKDWPAMLRIVSSRASRLFLVPVKSKRGLPPEDMASYGTVCSSLSDALAQTGSSPEILITGSLFLVGEAMELLGVSPSPVHDERTLNER